MMTILEALVSSSVLSAFITAEELEEKKHTNKMKHNVLMMKKHFFISGPRKRKDFNEELLL